MYQVKVKFYPIKMWLNTYKMWILCNVIINVHVSKWLPWRWLIGAETCRRGI